MSKISRRKLLTTGLLAAAGATGLGVAAKLAERYGLIPPDAGVLYGAGETLTYAAQRIFARHSLAREFARSQISKDPFANPVSPLGAEFQRLQAGRICGLAPGGRWHGREAGIVLAGGDQELPPQHPNHHERMRRGLVLHRRMEWPPARPHPEPRGRSPQARYVVYRSFQPDWWDSIDMADALHPQTLLAIGMNGGDLPVPFGGPLRLRVPRQLGYKNVKYLTRLTLTDDLKRFGKGLGSATPEGGYAWYAGI